MKKLLLISSFAVLLLSACNTESAKEETEKTNTSAASEQKADMKQELMRFYMSVPKTINAVDSDLNIFEAHQEKGTLPEGEELKTVKAAAVSAAEAAGDSVNGIEIPASLSDHQEEIQSAFDAIQESYQMKTEALSEEEVSFEAANAKFTEADEVFNALLEEQGLNPSSILNEVTK